MKNNQGEVKRTIIENRQIENVDRLLHLITNVYGKEKMREMLFNIIFEYSQLMIKELSVDGKSVERGVEANEKMQLLKEIADALQEVEVSLILETQA